MESQVVEVQFGVRRCAVVHISRLGTSVTDVMPCNACVCAKSLQSCLTLCDSVHYSPPGSSVYGDSLGKNTGVSCHALLQGVFPTQGSNLHLLCLLH